MNVLRKKKKTHLWKYLWAVSLEILPSSPRWQPDYKGLLSAEVFLSSQRILIYQPNCHSSNMQILLFQKFAGQPRGVLKYKGKFLLLSFPLLPPLHLFLLPLLFLSLPLLLSSLTKCEKTPPWWVSNWCCPLGELLWPLSPLPCKDESESRARSSSFWLEGNLSHWSDTWTQGSTVF